MKSHKALATLIAALFLLWSPCYAGTLLTAQTELERGNFEAAFAQFKQLASADDAAAQFQLSLLYSTGRGTRQDPKEAIRWLRMSAVHGYPPAQSNLGVAYLRGRGVAEDPIRAYAWLAAAAENGDSIATTNRDIAARKMSDAQLGQAKALLTSCQKGGFKGCL